MLRPRDLQYETAVGEIRRVPLPDGSAATINTASRIRVAFGSGLRRIALQAGEAWFQVAKDPVRAFLVEAGAVRVRATGTAFSVRRRPDGSEVLVTEGAVEVWADDARLLKANVAAGDAVFISDDGRILREALDSSAVDRRLAWRAGKIELIGQPLSAAIAEFNRYNHRQIVLADPRLGREQFDGVFRTDDPVGFAKTVRISLDTPLDLSDPGIIRLGAGR
jgi:transmembrane sensor